MKKEVFYTYEIDNRDIHFHLPTMIVDEIKRKQKLISCRYEFSFIVRNRGFDNVFKFDDYIICHKLWKFFINLIEENQS